MPKILHFVGGPGCGKSVLSAEVYVELKKCGFHAEQLQEPAKQLVWQGRLRALNNQYRVSEKYADAIAALEVPSLDMVVLDSSPLFGLWHNANSPTNVSDRVKTAEMISARFLAHENVVFVLTRGHFPYEQEGRMESEAAAKVMDHELDRLTDNLISKCPHMFVDVDNYNPITLARFAIEASPIPKSAEP